jgi:hypothetical protein
VCSRRQHLTRTGMILPDRSATKLASTDGGRRAVLEDVGPAWPPVLGQVVRPGKALQLSYFTQRPLARRPGESRDRAQVSRPRSVGLALRSFVNMSMFPASIRFTRRRGGGGNVTFDFKYHSYVHLLFFSGQNNSLLRIGKSRKRSANVMEGMHLEPQMKRRLNTDKKQHHRRASRLARLRRNAFHRGRRLPLSGARGFGQALLHGPIPVTLARDRMKLVR